MPCRFEHACPQVPQLVVELARFASHPLYGLTSQLAYPLSQAPAWSRPFLELNPFTHLAVAYQEVLFIPGPFEGWRRLLVLAAVSVLVFLVGYFVFDRLRDTLAEEV